MIYIKTNKEIDIMREGGKISKKILDKALELCIPGATTKEIDAKVENLMKQYDVYPWFKDVDHYGYATCVSLNDVWLHGVPGNMKLNAGDVVSIDIGVKYKGYYLDNCWSIVVQSGNNKENVRCQFYHKNHEVTKFLKIGAKALMESAKLLKSGKRIGDVSSKMQMLVEGSGYSVIRDYTGHGVGIHGHEEPVVACYGTKGAGTKIKRGMVCAIEVMHSMGKADTSLDKDGWTVRTKDKSISAMFEHTVAVTENGPEILTK